MKTWMHVHRCRMFEVAKHVRRSFAFTFAWTWLAASSLSAAILDFSGPIQPVQVTQTADLLRYQVFDPAHGVVEDSSAIPAFINLVQADGVIAWSDGSQVHLRTYDPSTGSWTGLDVPGAANTDLQTADGVVAWSTASRVYTVVYDQSRHEWRGHDAIPISPPLNLTTAHGIATWSSSSSAATAVQYTVYNPVSGLWVDRATRFDGSIGIQDLKTLEGVVAWSIQGTVFFRAFNPVSASWIESLSTASGSVFDLVVGDGIAAWSQSSLVRAFVYDPTRNEWRGASFPPSAFVTNLRISSGSVLWTGGGNNRTAGYDAVSGNWSLPLTAPRAFLGVSRNSGNAPLDVYFFDMSLGASTWSWNFGDGGGSVSQRSPYHRFTNFGSNTVTLAISSPTGGVFTATAGIRTDIEKPTGTILINNGDSFTTNALVNLTLTATDNSGSVQSMRFSNDGVSWSAWETFALNKQWIVASATGTNTVFAQFQDRGLNVSDPVSDGISVDTTPPPFIRFAMENQLLPENTNTVAIQIRLSHALGRPVSVDVFSTESSATSGLDFMPVNQRITFPAGTTNQLVNLTIINDTEIELNETFFLSLANATNGVAGGPATLTIIDDDLPTISFAMERFAVAENVESGEAVIAVRLSSPTGAAVSVDYLSTAGTATSGVDYQNNSGRLTFTPGQQEQTFPIIILQDTMDEFTETVLLELRNPANAPLGAVRTAVLEILDEDPPQARLASQTFTVRENAPNGAAIDVLLSSPFDTTVELVFSFEAITARAGSDYFNATPSVTFLSGKTNAQVFVNLVDNNTPEADETLRIRITDYSNATPGSITEAILTIEDDDRPVFHSPRLTATGLFESQIAMPFGLNIQVQGSTNYNQWFVLTNIFGTPTNAVFVDPESALLPRRAYRVVVP